MARFIISIALFAAVIYYFNIDLIKLLDKTGIPQWVGNQFNVPIKATSTASTSTR